MESVWVPNVSLSYIVAWEYHMKLLNKFNINLESLILIQYENYEYRKDLTNFLTQNFILHLLSWSNKIIDFTFMNYWTILYIPYWKEKGELEKEVEVSIYKGALNYTTQ